MGQQEQSQKTHQEGADTHTTEESPWNGQCWLITGAAGDLGSALAHYLAARGATLVLLDKNKRGLDALADQLEATGADAPYLFPLDLGGASPEDYHRFAEDSREVCVTYDMTRLQHLDADERLLVSLSETDHIEPARILRRIDYHHPVYNTASVAARGRRSEISGANRTFYCGAYWGYGFHEDGVRSGADVVAEIEHAVAAGDSRGQQVKYA